MAKLTITEKTWTEIPESGAVRIAHQSGSKIVYVLSDSEPSSFDSSTEVFSVSNQGDVVDITGIIGGSLWAYALTGSAAISYTVIYTADSAIQKFEGIDQPRQAVTSATLTEIYTALGYRYSMSYMVDIAASADLLILVTPPATTDGRLLAIRDITLDTDTNTVNFIEGWGITASTAGAQIDAFNENRKVSSVANSGFTTFNVATGVTYSTPRDYGRAQATGQGSKTIGSAANRPGYRVYDDSPFVLHFTNTEASVTSVIVAVEYLETPIATSAS